MCSIACWRSPCCSGYSTGAGSAPWWWLCFSWPSSSSPGFFALRPRTERGEDYTITSYEARSQGHLTVPVPASALPELVERACAHDADLGLRELDAQGGRISVGITFSSWGARVRFALRPVSETASQIVATSHPRMPLELWGRAGSERNLSLLFRGVARKAERTHTSET